MRSRDFVCRRKQNRREERETPPHPAGGSEAIFFKLNRVGEKSFLNTVIDAIEQL